MIANITNITMKVYADVIFIIIINLTSDFKLFQFLNQFTFIIEELHDRNYS